MLGTSLHGGTVLQLRGLAWLALTDTGHVGAGTVVSDGGGGGTTTWSYGPAVPCRVDPFRPKAITEEMLADKLSDLALHKVRVPVGTEVTLDSRFLIDGHGTFEVTSVEERTDQMIMTFGAVLLAS
jgi:hypothetical protein